MSILLVSGRAASSNETELICRPFGTCEPCPEDALREPFCQPFGNRRLTHCVPNTPGHAPSDGTSEHDAPGDDVLHGQPGLDSPHGEIPAWESCGRIVEQERADFYEFFACNFVIAVIALFVLFARTKRLQAMHARQLAARIGLVRGTPGGWVNG
ncbi:hypothetical protein CERSUDRAFT_116870 [Gelatoporia subvermispora B]|uniref:Uncharacterized protein n=1 Tax=Ceriporiopsis subvermispora (strain B) TaxID=914234 RepID=M2QR68_CERS8|nr:hypothetical protein CERSUDRAFT_116870 [Gelatoporia subvermispora B]